MAGRAPGTPLLTIGDLLRDLSERPPSAAPVPEEPDSPNTIRAKKIAFLESFLHPSRRPPPKRAGAPPPAVQPNFEQQNLAEFFEKTYDDLTKALAEDGYGWTGLTEQLSTALTTANKLISTTDEQTGPLLDQVRTLQALVERGLVALAKLQTTMAHEFVQ